MSAVTAGIARKPISSDSPAIMSALLFRGCLVYVDGSKLVSLAEDKSSSRMCLVCQASMSHIVDNRTFPDMLIHYGSLFCTSSLNINLAMANQQKSTLIG